jgi:uncharacterized phage-associated protein
MAGGIEYDRQKFEELIVYIARRLGPEAALGRVKLAKLLMLSDFTAWQRNGRSITGARYEKWEHGHLPHELIMAEKDLETDGRISKETVDYFGKQLRHITADEERGPNLAAFDEDEIAVVEGVLRRYGHESAKYLRHLSHEEIGWKLAADREEIPYETALIPTNPPPESVFEEFRELYGLPN